MIPLMQKINQQWKHISAMNNKILTEQPFVKGLRQQISLAMVEQQYQMMCSLAHLYLAFTVSVEIFKATFEKQKIQMLQNFIKQFEEQFSSNIASFTVLVSDVSSQKEFSHLKHKLPSGDFSQLLDHIYKIKEQFLLYSKAKHKTPEAVLAQYKISELLNLNMEVMGLKIPIPFMVYDNFHLVCHEHFDVLLCNKAYRDKLG